MATYHSERRVRAISPRPGEEEVAAIAAALTAVLEEIDTPALERSRWARVGRLEALGLAPGPRYGRITWDQG